MNIIKYIILAIIKSITEILPLSGEVHHFILEKTFNTNIFNIKYYNLIGNIGIFITLIFIYFKDIKKIIKSSIIFILSKKRRTTTNNDFKYLLNIFFITLIIILTNFISKPTKLSIKSAAIALILNALLLFFSNKKNSPLTEDNLSLKKLIIINILLTITIFFKIPYFTLIYFGCIICKTNKKSAIKYTFLSIIPTLFINIIFNLKQLNNLVNIDYYITELLSTIFISYFIYKKLINLINKDKLHLISYYCLFIALFIIYWFR